MLGNLTGTVAYTNGVYRVEQIAMHNDWEGDTAYPNWGVVNEEYETMEQATFTLFQAVEVADGLKQGLEDAQPQSAQLSLI